MKTLLTLVFTLAAFISYGQDTTYYDKNGSKVKGINEAYYFTITKKTELFKQSDSKSFFVSGQLRSEYKTANKFNTSSEWYENGQLKRVDTTDTKGKLIGQVISYWGNGVMKRNDLFKKGKLVKGNCYDKDGKEIEHFDYEVMPSFPGGETMMLRYLATETKYPPFCAENGIQGTVYVNFVVEKDGHISIIKVLNENRIDKNLVAEAVRVVYKMPKWTPGVQDGEPVKVMFTIPVRFALQESHQHY
jgi:protein TonB